MIGDIASQDPEQVMARNEKESAWATFWQLQAFLTACQSESWSEAEARLGVDKYRIVKAVDRLSDKLGVEKLVVDLKGRPHVSNHAGRLAKQAEEILDAYRILQRKAGSRSGRDFWIRCDAYWAHMKHFLSKAIGDFEEANSDVQIELRPGFGAQRNIGGVGLVADLLARSVDFVVAPYHGNPDRGIESRFLYRWALVAAVHDRHPLLHRVDTQGRLKVSELAGYHILTSPPGHRTRALLELHQSVTTRFSIEAAGPEPSALVALGEWSERVPVIASDSVVEWGPHWPILISADERALGGEYYAYWRKGRAHPQRLTDLLRDLAARAASEAHLLRSRVERWSDLDTVK
jgi:DNA-binding transcriptional LysR family regulator